MTWLCFTCLNTSLFINETWQVEENLLLSLIPPDKML